MKPAFTRLCAMVLVLTLLLSGITLISSSANETATIVNPSEFKFSEDTPFVKTEDEKGIHFYGPTGDIMPEKDDPAAQDITCVEDYHKFTQTDSNEKKTFAPVGSNPTLPSSVDNSDNEFFPAIGNQDGIGACGTFAAGYYQFTYHINKERNVKTTAENTFSPKWIYNLTNGGSDDGTMYQNVYKLLSDYGCAPLSLVPYNDEEFRNWHADEGIWREASRARIEGYQELAEVGITEEDTLITSADDKDLELIKTALANGDVLTYSSYIYSWTMVNLKTHPDAPENSKYQNEYALKEVSSYEGSHRMALVGYNDNIWVDINENNQVDSGEMGAFKIVNSWGEGYCNNGFAWVAYDALNDVSVVEGAVNSGNRQRALSWIVRIDALPYNYNAEAYIQFKLNTADRSQFKVIVTAEKDGTEYSHQFFWGIGYQTENNRFSFDGSNEACDGTFAYSLDNIVPDIDITKASHYSWSVNIIDKDETLPEVQVKDVRIVSEAENMVFTTNDELPFTINGEEKSVKLHESSLKNAVIYYIGFDSPTLHYKDSSNDWAQVKMAEEFERLGHNYKYVIENVSGDICLYFTDEKGNTDDNNGNYYYADKRLNYYRSSGEGCHAPLEPLSISMVNGKPDLNKYTQFDIEATGGYEPYNLKYTFENLTTGEIKVYDYNTIYADGHPFRSEGLYKITVDVMDQAKDVSTVTMEYDLKDQPFVFSSFCATSDEKMFVGNEITFKADSECEGVYHYAGKRNKYDFVIKDSEGNTVYTEKKNSDKYHFLNRNSTTTLNWTPYKSGKFSITISSTDISKEFAEKTFEFEVFDKIYGDADGNNVINIKDATAIQKKVALIPLQFSFYDDMADCDINISINIKDATLVQKYIASFDETGEVGRCIEYIPPEIPTEPTVPETTPPATEEPTTTPVTPVLNKVTFTNSFRWDGNIYCYYWSDSDTNMTSWPGQAMTYSETNGFNEAMYTFIVPEGATYIIFSNGRSQTTDIPYPGGEVRYYPISETDSNGNNKVNTW